MAEAAQQDDDTAANSGENVALTKLCDSVIGMTKSPRLLKFPQAFADTLTERKGLNPNNEARFSMHSRRRSLLPHRHQLGGGIDC
jgi:hypothetical protein